MAIKKLLKVLLSDDTDIVFGRYNRSQILWEDLKLKLGQDTVKKLGLYEPYYYTNDPTNAKYIQSYTIGDLINFLHYCYYYQTIESSKNCPEEDNDSHEHEKIYVHRYITIYLEDNQYANKGVRDRMRVSEIHSNDRNKYVWKVRLGDVVIATDVELIEALYKAIKIIYFDRALYKIPLSEQQNYPERYSGISKVEVDNGRLLTTNFDAVNDIVNGCLNSEDGHVLNTQHCRYRNMENLNTNTGAKFVEVYDIGDMLNLLHCNYYVKINIGDASSINRYPEYDKDKGIYYNRIISIAPVHKAMLGSEENYKGEKFDYTHSNNFSDYIWIVKAGADILGYKENLAEAMSDAVIDIYNNKKWYKIVVDEYKITENVEEETEFSLTDV